MDHPVTMTAGKSIPEYAISQTGSNLVLYASGEWTLHTIRDIAYQLQDELAEHSYNQVSYDLCDVTKLDTAGAYVFASAIRGEGALRPDWKILQSSPAKRILIEAAADAVLGRPPPATRPWYDTLTRVGQATMRALDELYQTLVFLGHLVVILGKQLLRPMTIRWKSVVSQIENVGLDATPIILLLSFFIGAVIAFMGENLLAAFGAQVFMVDLVGFAVLREFAVLITAIMLAGRSASAFTAQIGAQKMRQEVDAMTVIGLDTYETLVAPRAIACVVSAPILTFLAMLSGIFGGMLVAWLGPSDLSPILFFSRLKEAVEINNFWVGLVKAPFFGMIIAIIGCRQGLAVTGSVDSLGGRTTASVVQAIFSVIVMDAIFAILFLEMGV